MAEHINDPFEFSLLPPLSLYVHIPWCVRKCPYCDFNSHQSGNETIPERHYIDALLRDLEQDLPSVWGRGIYSIFIGGGTPSLLSPNAIDRLLSGIRALLPFPGDMEITLEANPGTTDAQRFAEYHSAGITRLSIGIQSFTDRLLTGIGRIHDARQARDAVQTAQHSGIRNINIDLMFGLPQQTPADAIHDIETALSLAPTHISHYQLTLEPNTLFHAKPPPTPDSDHCWRMQQECAGALSEAGFHHYEISAYAQPGHHCRHNLNYWRYGDYLGIGAGAHSKITNARHHTITRAWKLKHPNDYLANAHSAQRIGDSRVITPDDAVLEFMMNALRLNEGFDVELFIHHTGLSIDRLKAALKEATDKGWIHHHGNRVCPTPQGRLFLNDLLTTFVPDQ